jgi:hypothetical protein
LAESGGVEGEPGHRLCTDAVGYLSRQMAPSARVRTVSARARADDRRSTHVDRDRQRRTPRPLSVAAPTSFEDPSRSLALLLAASVCDVHGIAPITKEVLIQRTPEYKAWVVRDLAAAAHEVATIPQVAAPILGPQLPMVQ